MKAELRDSWAAPPLAELLVRAPTRANGASSAPTAWALDGGRFLVPNHGRAASRALLSYNRLRPRRVRAARAALAALVCSPARRWVSSPVALPTSDEPTLIEHLAMALGEPSLLFAATDTGGTGWRTPVLQLFTPDGMPRGYAKVGWDPVTRGMIETEAAALARTTAAGWNSVTTPSLAWVGSYHDLSIVVTNPMPTSTRRLRASELPAVHALHEIATLHGPLEQLPLRTSPFWTRALETAEFADAPPSLLVGTEAIAVRFRDAEVTFGSWHGDWVEWNLGRAKGRLVAWDWAYCAPDTPFGFDVLQFFYLRYHNLRGECRQLALEHAARDASPYLAELGIRGEDRDLVTALHRVEVALRDERARQLRSVNRSVTNR